jgi:hypothetical protein
VLAADQVGPAVQAGATFVVVPDTDETVVRAAHDSAAQPSRVRSRRPRHNARTGYARTP